MKYKKPLQWSRLENAAKIFPSTSSKRDTKVFRFTCELYEAVNPAILQNALDNTMEKFPFYRSVLKRGIFWYYFETSRLTPMIAEETKPPCSPIYNGDRKNLLFEVTYYRNRINLEVYHALSDGTGALHFLRTLVYYYIMAAHKEQLPENIPFDYDASEMQKRDDSFSKYYNKKMKRSETPKQGRAFRVRGERFPEYRIGVIEGCLPMQGLLAEAKKRNVTVTAFLAGVLIYAIHENMALRDCERPVVVTIPVNLRNYFPSASARNFFGVVNVSYHFKERDGSLEDIIAYVGRELAKQLKQECLQERMNQLSALEHNFAAKMIPLILKDTGMKVANWISERQVTAAMSNVGKITMPSEIESYIKLFDVFVATKRLQTCICSFQNNIVISFTAPFISTDIQRCFFRILTGFGIAVELAVDIPEME